MMTLSAATAADYLVSCGRVAAAVPLRVRELSGGVSNVVLLVEGAGGERLVLKQALPRLRVEQEWLCSIERIWREVEVLRLCGALLAATADREPETGKINLRIPQVLFEDRENYCFGMTAAPAEHRTWKDLLLAGEAETPIAEACGGLLGKLHAGSWLDANVARQLDDRTFFRDLRISPYYDRIGQVHPDLADAIGRVSDAIWQHRCCLVHGDFSPKNLLVAGSELWLIDFEVGHYGDPAFDLGFFLTHLTLKAFVAGEGAAKYLDLIDAFRRTYAAELLPAAGQADLSALWQRTIGALAGCLLARVDGKSPVDYLTPPLQAAVRNEARGLLASPPSDFSELLSRVTAAVAAAAPRSPSSAPRPE